MRRERRKRWVFAVWETLPWWRGTLVPQEPKPETSEPCSKNTSILSSWGGFAELRILLVSTVNIKLTLFPSVPLGKIPSFLGMTCRGVGRGLQHSLRIYTNSYNPSSWTCFRILLVSTVNIKLTLFPTVSLGKIPSALGMT